MVLGSTTVYQNGHGKRNPRQWTSRSPSSGQKKEADYHLHIQGAGACDNIIGRLNAGNFTFRSVSLDESPEVKEQLGRFLSRLAQGMDFAVGPLLSLGVRLYTGITTFGRMIEEMEMEKD